MAYGACDHCGCAYEECERTRKETEMKTKKPYGDSDALIFKGHGTYISDLECFDVVKKLGLHEAFRLLKESEHVKGPKPRGLRHKTDGSTDAYFLINKGWAIVGINKEQGYVEAVYNHDGRYSLRRAGMQKFLSAIRYAVSYSEGLRSLNDSLMAPHEHA